MTTTKSGAAVEANDRDRRGMSLTAETARRLRRLTQPRRLLPARRAADPSSPPPVYTALDEPVGTERRTLSVELLWDLVFVLAVTQVTTLLAHHPTWLGLAQAMVALALIWWAWTAYVWASNVHGPDSRTLQPTLLLASILIFVCGLALPQAFGADGLLFAGTYCVVRILHVVLYGDAVRRGTASRDAILGFSVTVLLGATLLLVGASLSGAARLILWAGAVVVDYAGPGWLIRRRVVSLQRLAAPHFAERYGAFIIICLGESVIAIGLGGKVGRTLTLPVGIAAGAGMLIAVAMWWAYFDRLAEATTQALRRHPRPMLLAIDAYSYAHLVIVAGIVLFATGVKLVLDEHQALMVSDADRLMLCGGAALYILGLGAFRWRVLGTPRVGHVAAIAVVCLGLVLGPLVSEWLLAPLIVAALTLTCADERRSLSRDESSSA
jgi:low temperature requirement protein LtrA